jgi:hypothetical protein
MQIRARACWGGAVSALLVAAAGLLTPGCFNSPVDLAQGPAPLRMPPPDGPGGDCACYEDSLTGGRIFQMYCAECHNARPLAERPFAQYKNVAAHMRVRANLTGKEYAKLMAFLRRWADVPPPTPETTPSPKKLIFGQPIPELRPEAKKDGAREENGQPEKAPPPQPLPAPPPVAVPGPDARPG